MQPLRAAAVYTAQKEDAAAPLLSWDAYSTEDVSYHKLANIGTDPAMLLH